MLLYPASIQTNKKIKTHRVDVIEDVELFCSSSGGTFENEDDAEDFFRLHPVKKGPTRIVEISKNENPPNWIVMYSLLNVIGKKFELSN